MSSSYRHRSQYILRVNRLNIFSALTVFVFYVALSSIIVLFKYDLHYYEYRGTWNKVRDSTAAKLQDGDVTDAKIREIVVRDLNDLKTNSMVFLVKIYSAAIVFLKQGVDLLNVSLDQLTHSTQENRCESSTMSNDVASATLNEVLELTCAVGKIKIKSCAEYESAKERFKDTRKKATEAFCSEALGIEDRIFEATGSFRYTGTFSKALEPQSQGVCRFFEIYIAYQLSVRYSLFISMAESSRCWVKKNAQRT